MGRVLLIGDNPELAGTLVGSPRLRAHEIENCTGGVEALRRIRDHAVDVVLTDPGTSMAEDLALAGEALALRPGVRVIVLAAAASPEQVIASLRAHVFACFTMPFDYPDMVDMIRRALDATGWRDGIEVTSGLPDWFTMRVSSHLLTAERLVRFMAEYQSALPDDQRDLLMTAFREMLLNAMEHGSGFDSEKVIEVTAAKTERAIVYHFRDSGSGFDRAGLPHAARSFDPEDVLATTMRRAEMGLRPGGLGVLITRQIADELVFNERGNEVLLIKYL
jgi:anti-sigma regulatory factor (Ser/Thr protein kinase)/CheY-like chemotaxis protein